MDKKLIVFDMDGVIIDVSDSYRDTTRQAARLFFSHAGDGDQLTAPLFSFAELARVKQSGGLNNDWDLTYAVISSLFSLVDCPAVSDDPDPWVRFEQTMAGCSVARLAAYLDGSGDRLFSLYEQTRKNRNPFVADMYKGDVGSGNIIKQIFQEIYLGLTLFEETYGRAPSYHHEKGLIHREKLLIAAASLSALASNNILAIATGRPADEAAYPLALHGIQKYFDSLLTLDDCLAEERRLFAETGKKIDLGKPNPFMLDRIATRWGEEVREIYYIGDMPDDMTAANRSSYPYIGVGVLFTSPDRDRLSKALQDAGARHVVAGVAALVDLLSRSAG